MSRAAGRRDTTAPSLASVIASRVAGLAGLVPGERVLAAGCGTGTVLARAAGKVAPSGHVTGTGLPALILECAAAEARQQGLANVTICPGQAGSPPGSPRSYDVVLSSLAGCQLPGPAAALAAWRTLVLSWVTGRDPQRARVHAAAGESTSGPGLCSGTTPLPGPGGMQAILRKLGYQHVTIRTQTITTVCHSPQQFRDTALTPQRSPRDRGRPGPPGSSARYTARRCGYRNRCAARTAPSPGTPRSPAAKGRRGRSHRGTGTHII